MGKIMEESAKLKFTPLEFKTFYAFQANIQYLRLKFTPLEFKTSTQITPVQCFMLKFTPLEFKTQPHNQTA